MTLETLNGWLDVIRTDVTAVLTERYIYRSVAGIVEANPTIHEDATFYQWMAETYANSAALGIRRQLDTDRRTVSLRRLLDAINRHDEARSRSRFVSLYRSDRNPSTEDGALEATIWRNIANSAFDRIAGEGAEMLDTKPDIRRLSQRSRRVHRFVDTNVAHRSAEPVPLDHLPTFGDLDDALDLIEELLRKYWLLLRAESLVRVVPVWQYDWTSVFRRPWLRS